MLQMKITWQDVAVLLLVLLVALAMILVPVLCRPHATVLVITTPEGSTSYSLAKPQTVTVTSRGVTLTVVIEDGEAHVSHSDCRDGVCYRSGSISRSGETILCAPAGVKLTVKGGNSNVDFVAG